MATVTSGRRRPNVGDSNCENNVPLVYNEYTREQSVKMFESIGVLSEKELYAPQRGQVGDLHQKGAD